MPRYQTRVRTVAPAAEQLADHLTKGSHDIHDANHRVLYVYNYVNLYKSNRKNPVWCKWTPSKSSLSPKHATSPHTEKVPHPKSLLLPQQMILYLPHKLLIFATSLDSPNALIGWQIQLTLWYTISWLSRTKVFQKQGWESQITQLQMGKHSSRTLATENKQICGTLPSHDLQSPVETNATQWSIISCRLGSQ